MAGFKWPIISKLVSARGEPSDCLMMDVFKCLKSEISLTPDLFPSASYFWSRNALLAHGPEVVSSRIPCLTYS